jgi:hypothetical protein
MAIKDILGLLRLDALADEVRVPARRFAVDGLLNAGGGTTLTIVGGEVTISGGFHRLDTEAGAAFDDLDTINGGITGDRVLLKTASSGRDVTIKAGTGNISLSKDVTLSSAFQVIELVMFGGNWYLVNP